MSCTNKDWRVKNSQVLQDYIEKEGRLLCSISNSASGLNVHIHKPSLLNSADMSIGAKIRHVIGICGYKFSLGHVTDASIARYIGIDAATWTRLKKKSYSDESKLSRLTHYFRLDRDYGLTYEIFLLPTLGEFAELLEIRGVGAYGSGDQDYARHALMSATNFKPNGIYIESLREPTRVGGLTGDADRSDRRFVFSDGDAAILKIRHPDNGHLVVLNDCPDSEIIRLMPSQWAPQTKVHGNVTRLPTDDGEPTTFRISAPRGRYRLFSIWTPHPLRWSVATMQVSDTPTLVDARQLRQLANLIEAKDDNGDRYEIRSADYYVE